MFRYTTIALSRSLASFTLVSPLRLSNNTMIELSHSGTRIDMEWGEAALGCWLTGVHTRYVECDRLYNQFAVCGYSGTPCCFLLSSEYTSSVLSVRLKGKCCDNRFVSCRCKRKSHRSISMPLTCHERNGTPGIRCWSLRACSAPPTYSARWSSSTSSRWTRTWARSKCRSREWWPTSWSSSSCTCSSCSPSVVA